MKIEINAKVLEDIKKNLKLEMVPNIAQAFVTSAKLNITDEVDINGNSLKDHIDVVSNKILLKSGTLRNSIVVRNRQGYKFDIVADTPYAKIMNNGGTINQTLTDKQIAFFWAKYKETGNLKFKNAARAINKKIHIIIEKREFMGYGTRVIPLINQVINKFLAKYKK